MVRGGSADAEVPRVHAVRALARLLRAPVQEVQAERPPCPERLISGSEVVTYELHRRVVSGTLPMVGTGQPERPS